MKFNKSALHLHFVGIGGIGMSGIAQVFFNQGYSVSGSDLSESDTTRKLRELGLKIHIGHRSENVDGAHVVVISSAVRPINPEVVEAKKQRIPVIPRAEMLGELMRGKIGVSVGGTHGKTTTTSMLATVLSCAGLDPTLVIGGKVDSLGGNAKLGQGQMVIAEADESDGSFLHLPATFAVITNIDNDHLDHFGKIENIDQAFIDFIAKLPFYGKAVVCLDDFGVQRCISRFGKPFKTYGTTSEADYCAKDIVLSSKGSSYEVFFAGSSLGKVELNVLGKHNVLNSLAAFALADQMEIPISRIIEGLGNFVGVKRRFETRWKSPSGDRWIVEDYGHHPTEIQATLSAARSAWAGRVVVVFQPHRYSRTLNCWDGFLSCFEHADEVLVTDIYSAGEEAVDGVSAETLVQAIQKVSSKPQKYRNVSGSLEDVAAEVAKGFESNDLLLCMGAGSITRFPELIISLGV